MYYSVEIYPKHDIIIKDISDSEYQAVMEDNYLSLDRLITYRADGATVKTGRQIANYYSDRDKRNQFVCSLLESDSY